MEVTNQVVGFTVQGSWLTSMQHGVACGKNRMNSSFIFKSKPNTLDRWFDSILSL